MIRINISLPLYYTEDSKSVSYVQMLVYSRSLGTMCSFGVKMSSRLMEEQFLVKLYRIIELTVMKSNVRLNALLGRYSAFCPLNFANKNDAI